MTFMINQRRKNKLMLLIKGIVSMKPFLRIACWSPKVPLQTNNIGDDLNIPLLSAITGKFIIPLQWSIRSSHWKCYSVIGSIIPWWINGNTYVWGSGIKSTDAVFYHKPRKVYAVRGPLTRQALVDNGVECPEIYGDPALLAPLAYSPQINTPHMKKFRFGIILHENDYSDTNRINFADCHDESITFIDICYYSNWTDVIDRMCQCKCIISSSLHGLILADAYRVPSIWAKFNYDFGSGYVKFHDYFLTVGRDSEEIHQIDSYEDIQKLIIPKCNSKIDIRPLIESCPFDNNLPEMYHKFLAQHKGMDYIYAE